MLHSLTRDKRDQVSSHNWPSAWVPGSFTNNGTELLNQFQNSAIEGEDISLGLDGIDEDLLDLYNDQRQCDYLLSPESSMPQMNYSDSYQQRQLLFPSDKTFQSVDLRSKAPAPTSEPPVKSNFTVSNTKTPNNSLSATMDFLQNENLMLKEQMRMQKETISQLMEALKSKTQTNISSNKTQSLLQTAESKEVECHTPAIANQTSSSDSANAFNTCPIENQGLLTRQHSSPILPSKQAKFEWEWHTSNEENQIVSIPMRKRKLSQLIEVQKTANRKYHHNYDEYVKKFTFK